MCFPERIRGLPPFAGAFRARSLGADGCRILFACYEAGQRIPAHHHETENIGVVTGGELRLTVEGVERAYRPGEWYQIPARAPHAARFDVPTAIIEFWFTA